jgi:hypothetical protein
LSSYFYFYFYFFFFCFFYTSVAAYHKNIHSTGSCGIFVPLTTVGASRSKTREYLHRWGLECHRGYA